MFRLAKNGLEAVKTNIEWIKDSVEKLHSKMDNLPCKTHAEQIKTLFKGNEKEEKSTDRKMYVAIGVTAIIVSVVVSIIQIIF